MRLDFEINTTDKTFEQAKEELIKVVDEALDSVKEKFGKHKGFSEKEHGEHKQKALDEQMGFLKSHYVKQEIADAVDPIIDKYGLTSFVSVFSEKNGNGATFWVDDKIQEVSTSAARALLKESLRDTLKEL